VFLHTQNEEWNNHMLGKIKRKLRLSGFSENLRQRFMCTDHIDLSAVGWSVRVNPGDIALDCGANVGDLTSRFARSSAKVYAFEPNSLCVKVLKNRFHTVRNVEIIHAGVMDRACTLELTTPKAHAGFDDLSTTVSATFQTQPKGERLDYDVNKETVNCIDLNEFILNLGQRVRLLKIDIEGAEIEVLNKLIDTRAIDLVDYVVVETHAEQMPHLKEATSALKDRINSEKLLDKVSLDWY
jgi:FkbM family methyltransferase